MVAQEYAEILTSLAVGVFASIFISAFVTLIVVFKKLRRNKCALEELIHADDSSLEFSDADFNKNIEKVLQSKQWVDDTSGLIPHCLAILKSCKFLTEKLTSLAVEAPKYNNNGFSPIVESARRISNRVNDMVRSMYPPLEPKLLEARAAALALAVGHLALIAKYECGHSDQQFVWVDNTLIEINSHLTILRNAAINQESGTKPSLLSVNTISDNVF